MNISPRMQCSARDQGRKLCPRTTDTSKVTTRKNLSHVSKYVDMDVDEDRLFYKIPSVHNSCFLCEYAHCKTREEMLDHLNVVHPSTISQVVDIVCSKPKLSLIHGLGCKFDAIHQRVLYSPDADIDEFYLIGRFRETGTLTAIPEDCSEEFIDDDTLYHWKNAFNHLAFYCSFIQFKGFPWCICALNEA